MSFQEYVLDRVTYVPPGGGERVWAFSGDQYTIKGGVSDTGPGLGVAEAVIPPLSGPPLHVHHREDEAFYVLDGRLEVAEGERTLVAEAGSFVFTPRGTPHRFRNVGSDACRMLLLFAPAGFERFFAEVGVAVVDDQPPPSPEQYPQDVARAMEIAAEKYGIEPA
ncbi:MAG: Quercetin 2,3-dioxygenase [uncultured Corynebacteriales bacterium]|uniref:Quercetin 2,3-dioxygenase n=1 Tax=uncultured Mycobacteriales bacterium TaxID=581187 RepID=A0A6J4JH18_9ACTN|nr:MAG: Quercetin 2,3-dioxygenase [uncultured Corynebacteriales bacterium]